MAQPHQCGAACPSAVRICNGTPSSYQDALLGRVVSAVGRIPSDGANCKQHRGPVPVLPPAAVDVDERSQVVRRRRASCRVSLPTSKLHSPRYLTAVAGRCLNCLSTSHRRATCRLPTRCFNCHGVRHHLRDCKRPRRPAPLQVSRNTLSPRGDGRTSNAPASMSMVVNGSLEPELFFLTASTCFVLRSWDPMVEEAAMGAMVHAPICSHQEDVSDMEQQLANPLSTAMSPQVSSLLPLSEESQTPELLRSEEQQLIGHELIKALSNFKLLMVPPSSPTSCQKSPSSKETTIVRPEGNKSQALSVSKQLLVCPMSSSTVENEPSKQELVVVSEDDKLTSQKRMLQRKPRRPTTYKVVRNMLTRKWIFIKDYKQLGDWSLRRFMDTYKKLSSTNNTAALRNLMEAVRKLTQASKKRKKKEKVLSHILSSNRT